MNPQRLHDISMKLLAGFMAISVGAALSCASATPEVTPVEIPGAGDRTDVGAEVAVAIDHHAIRRATGSSFTLFESGQVRPLALSQDGHHLFAVNTPDHRLEVFRIGPNRLTHTA